MDNCFFCGAEGIACYTKADDKGVDRDACFSCAKGPAVGPPIIQERRAVGRAASAIESVAPVAFAAESIEQVVAGKAVPIDTPKLKIQKPAYVVKAEKKAAAPTEDLAAAYAAAIDSRKDRAAILDGTAECKNGHKICLENANPADLRRIQKYYCQPCIKGYSKKS